MPYSKDPSQYPEDFWNLLREVAARDPTDHLRHAFPNRSAAIGFRARFNGWRVAIKDCVRKNVAPEAARLTQKEFDTLCVLSLRIEPSYHSKQEQYHKHEACTLIFETQPLWASDMLSGVRKVVADLCAPPPEPPEPSSQVDDVLERMYGDVLQKPKGEEPK